MTLQFKMTAWGMTTLGMDAKAKPHNYVEEDNRTGISVRSREDNSIVFCPLHKLFFLRISNPVAYVGLDHIFPHPPDVPLN